MRITPDTNVLLRAVVCDDLEQATLARAALAEAELIAVTIPALCEFVWVLRKTYAFQTDDIAAAIRALVATDKVAMDRPVVEAGLELMASGGDFADGVIAYEGQGLGGGTFLSFDKKAVSLLTKTGQRAQRL